MKFRQQTTRDYIADGFWLLLLAMFSVMAIRGAWKIACYVYLWAT
jgi:hypothetical protein